MLNVRLLSQAVTEGIITADQEQRLLSLATAPPPAIGSEPQERFRVIRDFNDVFISVGVVLVAFAVQLLLPWLSQSIWDLATDGMMASPVVRRLVEALAGGALFWVLAELLVPRRRSALTGLVLLLVIAAFVVDPVAAALHAVTSWAFSPSPPANEYAWNSGTLRTIHAYGLLTLLFFLRFKLPIALGLFAACASLTLLSLIVGGLGEGWTFRGAAILIGVVILGAAIAIDVRDRMRLTWRSDAAFWLHAVSAPYIVLGVVGPQALQIVTKSAAVLEVSTLQWVTLVVSLTVLALVALVIDRRSLILSSILAWGVVLYGAFGTQLGWSGSIAQILLVLGIAVLLLGSFWQTIRRAVFLATRWLPIWAWLVPVQPAGRRRSHMTPHRPPMPAHPPADHPSTDHPAAGHPAAEDPADENPATDRR